MKILFLEDNISVLHSVSKLLTDEGHDIIKCLSIVDAQHTLNDHDIDCIITGLNMPPLGLTTHEIAETQGGIFSGWTWLKNYVIQKNKNIRVIILSAMIDQFINALPAEQKNLLKNISLISKVESNVIFNLIESIKEIENTLSNKSNVQENTIILLTPDTKVLKPEIIQDTIYVTKSSLSQIIKNPTLMYDLKPREFEKLIAEIYRNLGYDVELTKATRDGGKDIYIANKNELGSFLYLVECKKYAPKNPVGIEVIRNLYGVLEMDDRNANAAILCTTSRFTNDVIKEIEIKNFEHLISLKDFEGIKELLKRIT